MRVPLPVVVVVVADPQGDRDRPTVTSCTVLSQHSRGDLTATKQYNHRLLYLVTFNKTAGPI